MIQCQCPFHYFIRIYNLLKPCLKKQKLIFQIVMNISIHVNLKILVVDPGTPVVHELFGKLFGIVSDRSSKIPEIPLLKFLSVFSTFIAVSHS